MFNYVNFMRVCIEAVVIGSNWVALKDDLYGRANWLNEFDFDSNEATQYFMCEMMKHKEIIKLHHIQNLFEQFKQIADVVNWKE